MEPEEVFRRVITKNLLVQVQIFKRLNRSMNRVLLKLAKFKAIIIIMNCQWRLNIRLTGMGTHSKENWQKPFLENFRRENHFSITKVGSDSTANSFNSMVYVNFSTRNDNMYFHSLWKYGYSKIFANNRLPLNEWYKVQLIQSTHDGKSCRQKLRINDRSVWQKRLDCPPLKTGVQHIYTTGPYIYTAGTLIKNFKFFSHPLTN